MVKNFNWIQVHIIKFTNRKKNKKFYIQDTIKCEINHDSIDQGKGYIGVVCEQLATTDTQNNLHCKKFVLKLVLLL